MSEAPSLLCMHTIYSLFSAKDDLNLYYVYIPLSFPAQSQGQNGAPFTEEEKKNAMKNPAVNATVDDPSSIPWGIPIDPNTTDTGADNRNVWDSRSGQQQHIILD